MSTGPLHDAIADICLEADLYRTGEATDSPRPVAAVDALFVVHRLAVLGLQRGEGLCWPSAIHPESVAELGIFFRAGW